MRYLLCCLHSAPAAEREGQQRIQISEVVEQAPAPVVEESAELEAATQLAESYSDPGHVSDEQKAIAIPESRSLIFTDVATLKPPIAVKKKRKTKTDKSRKDDSKRKKQRENEEKRHTPPPRDARPLKSILKRR